MRYPIVPRVREQDFSKMPGAVKALDDPVFATDFNSNTTGVFARGSPPSHKQIWQTGRVSIACQIAQPSWATVTTGLANQTPITSQQGGIANSSIRI